MNEEYDIEVKAQQERTIQAIKEGWMGFEGKLGVIAQQLGEPIIANYGGGGLGTIGFTYNEFSTHESGDDESIEDARTPEEILYRMPMTDTDDPVLTGGIWGKRKDRVQQHAEIVGWNFDGLSRGMHLDIKCMLDDAKITVSYQGYLVYEEENSKLYRLKPNGWEELIERLYPHAKKKQRKAVKAMGLERKAEQEKEVKGIFQRIKDLWGL
jgi:hypothetical protein